MSGKQERVMLLITVSEQYYLFNLGHSHSFFLNEIKPFNLVHIFQKNGMKIGKKSNLTHACCHLYVYSDTLPIMHLTCFATAVNYGRKILLKLAPGGGQT